MDSSKLYKCNFGVLTKNNLNFSNYQTNIHDYGTILYLVGSQGKHGIIMGSPNECPFCGSHTIKKNPYSDRIKSAKVGAGALEVSGEGSIEIDPNPQKEEYYLCNGCNQQYVWADIDVNLILEHLDGLESVPELIRFYYPEGITLTDLIAKHRTGIVRRHNDRLSWLSNSIAKRQLYICFNYNGKRTFGVFVRKKKTKYYYTMKTMGVPKI